MTMHDIGVILVFALVIIGADWLWMRRQKP